MAKKKARGRPKKKPSETKLVFTQIRCTVKQKRALKSRAAAESLTVTEFILRRCLE